MPKNTFNLKIVLLKSTALYCCGYIVVDLSAQKLERNTMKDWIWVLWEIRNLEGWDPEEC